LGKGECILSQFTIINWFNYHMTVFWLFINST
jgi:hypothetical protein